MKTQELSRSERSLIARVKRNGPLHLERFQSEEVCERFFFLTERRAAAATVARRLIEGGVLVPQGDGLFGDSQTFVLSDEY